MGPIDLKRVKKRGIGFFGRQKLGFLGGGVGESKRFRRKVGGSKRRLDSRAKEWKPQHHHTRQEFCQSGGH